MKITANENDIFYQKVFRTASVKVLSALTRQRRSVVRACILCANLTDGFHSMRFGEQVNFLRA